MTLIKIPAYYNIYLNPEYYFDQSTHSDNLQKWLDQPITFKGQSIDLVNTILHFPLPSDNFYPYHPTIPLKTNLDILLACNEFYFETEIDWEYAHFNKLPIETGYWYFYLDITGSLLTGFEVRDTDEIIINLSKETDKISQSLNSTNEIKIKPGHCFLCKKCYHCNLPDKLNKRCSGCKTILIPDNIKT